MLHFLLQQFDFTGRKFEQAIYPVVQFGFGIGQGTREPGVLGSLLLQIRFPFIGRPGVPHGIRGELEALLHGVAELIQRQVPPRPAVSESVTSKRVSNTLQGRGPGPGGGSP